MEFGILSWKFITVSPPPNVTWTKHEEVLAHLCDNQDSRKTLLEQAKNACSPDRAYIWVHHAALHFPFILYPEMMKVSLQSLLHKFLKYYPIVPIKDVVV